LAAWESAVVAMENSASVKESPMVWKENSMSAKESPVFERENFAVVERSIFTAWNFFYIFFDGR